MIVLKSGELYIIENGTERKYLSPFIAAKIEAAARTEEHSGWKQKDDGESRGMFSRSTLWGRQSAPFVPPQITHVHECENGFFYVIKMGRASGLFRYDKETDSEFRLFHKENFNPAGLSVSATGIVTTVDSVDGSRHLAWYDRSGKNEEIITSGDCVDEHPWLGEDVVYYDSKGIGRTQDRAIGAFGPRGIYCVSKDGQDHRVIRESTSFEYLLPKVGADGSLYALRIPWDPNSHSPWSLIRDVLMFPYVLFMAIIGFINVFSILFAKRPIISAGGPGVPAKDLRKLMVHSTLLDLRKASKQGAEAALAPKSWKVVKLDGDSDIEIRHSVIGFSPDSSGLLLNTGFGIFSDQGEQLYRSKEIILDFTPNSTAPEAGRRLQPEAVG